MSARFFNQEKPIKFAGAKAGDGLAYRWYDPNKKVLGKRMEDHLRFAVCLLALLRLGRPRPVRRRDLHAPVDAHGRRDGSGAS